MQYLEKIFEPEVDEWKLQYRWYFLDKGQIKLWMFFYE